MWILLGFGEVNATLYEAIDWDGLDINVSLFSQPDRTNSASTKQRIAASAIPITSEFSQLKQAEVILSAVTPKAALPVARAIAPYLPPGCIYVDLNSVAGSTIQEISELIESNGGRFVDAAIMGPVPQLGLAVPIFLAGPHAEHFQKMAEPLNLNTTVISQQVPHASALKMIWSVMTKGTIGLLAESLTAAHRLGLLDPLTSLLAAEYGQVGSERMVLRWLQSTTRSGERRLEEMKAVRKTLESVGIPAHMVAGTSAWIALLTQVKSGGDAENVEEIVESISRSLPE